MKGPIVKKKINKEVIRKAKISKQKELSTKVKYMCIYIAPKSTN